MTLLAQVSPAVRRGVTVYFCAVVALALAAAGPLHGDAYWAWVALFVATLPWSIVPWFFAWALVHDGATAWSIARLAIYFDAAKSLLFLAYCYRKTKRQAEA